MAVVSALPLSLCSVLLGSILLAAPAFAEDGLALLQRIAQGSGVKIVEVNQLLKQFQQMQQMMKMFKGGGAKKMMRQMEAMKGKGGFPGMG